MVKLLVYKLEVESAIFSELLADLLVLKEVEKAQAVGIHEELGVLRLLPVLQVV